MRPTLPPILAAAGLVVVGTFVALRVGSQDSNVSPGSDSSPAVASLSMSSNMDPVLQSPTAGDAGSTEQADPGILKDIGLPQGPYDAVLVAPADPALLVPPTNRLVNNPVGENVGVTQSEVSIAVQGDKIAIGWNDGQGFVDGTNVSGYGYSTNRGVTWTDAGEVPDGTGTAVFGDPSVVVTNNGTWVFASLDRGTTSGLTINRSTWAGSVLTWNPAIKYNDVGNGSLDKEYLDYDPTLDRIYLTYVNLTTGNGRVARSTDLGLTWSTPTTVNSGGSANGYYPAAGIDGEVYVTWVQPLFQGNGQMYIRHSPDGGQNWSSNRVLIHQLGPQSGGAPQCFNRGVNITWPSAAVDKTDGPFRGRVYAAYSDGGTNNYDSYLRYSDDKGQTWSDAVKLNDDATNSEQFWPQITVGPDGRVTVGWHDRRNASGGNSLCDFYVTQSLDGGVTWGPNRRMSDTSVAWCGVPSNIQPNFGDYFETISDERSVFSVWSDARDGDPDVIFGRLDDVQTLAMSAAFAGGNDAQGGFEGTGTAYFIPNEAEIDLTPAPALESEADLIFVSTVLGLLATPDETKGIFQHAGDDLSGHLEFGSGSGNVRGDFSLVRTGDNGIDLQFTVDSDGLGNDYLDEITLDVTVTNGAIPGQVEIFGQARINQLFLPPAIFSVGGTLTLGSGGTLPANQRLQTSADYAVGSSLFLHTRTTVTDGVIVEAPDVELGTNPPPLAVLRSKPNPWVADTRISLELTHESTGSIRIFSAEGRLVRKLADGTWAPGAHEFPFDGKDDSGRDLATGGYFIRLESERVNAAAKFFVVR